MKTINIILLSISLIFLASCGGKDSPEIHTQLLENVSIVTSNVFLGPRSNYSITRNGLLYTVQDNVGNDGTRDISGVENLKFNNLSINRKIDDASKLISQKDLSSLIELYVAFFNRVPDADGLTYWINELYKGRKINDIADSFYTAGVINSATTGYTNNMSNSDFVNLVYKNVLGRTTGADPEGLTYWTNSLAQGKESRGSLVNAILTSAHSFRNNAQYGYVADLLDNKILIGRRFSIEEGITFNTEAESIAKGVTIAASVKNTDVATANGIITSLILPTQSDLNSCRLPEVKARDDVGIGFPKIPFRLRSTGTVKFTVLFVDFSDAPATRTPQSVLGIISPAAEKFFATTSYGRMVLTFSPNYKWIRMNKASGAYSWSNLTGAKHKEYIQEAINLGGLGINYADSDAILIVTNPDALNIFNGPTYSTTPGNEVYANGKAFVNVITSGHDLVLGNTYWFNHEAGHTMTLVDLYYYKTPTPENLIFMGEFSLMGNSFSSVKAPEHTGWERWVLGWLSDDKVVCAPTGRTTVSLAPIERLGGIKLLVVPTGATSAVAVEIRSPEGYDIKLPKAGPLVYNVDTSVASAFGPLKALPIDDSDISKTGKLLSPGQSVSFGSVSVTYIGNDSSGYKVIVNR